MKFRLLIIFLILLIFYLHCGKVEYDDLVLNISDNIEELDYKSNTEHYSNSEYSYSINDNKDEETLILPQEFGTQNIDTYENTTSEDIDELEEFDFEVYKSIIEEINSIISVNNLSRDDILINLTNYETGKFEIIYNLHRVMSVLSDKKRKNLLEDIRNNESFIFFLDNGFEYAENTLIAEIFQNLSFLKENANPLK